MLRRCVSLTILLGLVVCFALPGQSQDKADPAAVKDKGDKDKDKDEKKPAVPVRPTPPPPPPPNPWVKVGQLTGTLRSFQESDRSVALTIKTPELNPGAVQGMMQAQLQLRQAQFQSPQYRMQAMMNAQRSMIQHQANLYTMRDTDVTLKLHEDIKVRLNSPPPTFDEKGNLVKRYTPAQLKEMKGDDPKLPGYQATISDLQPGQIVAITLVQHKDKMRQRPKRPNYGVKNPDNADADLLMDDNKPQISMAVILGTPPGN